MRRERLKNLRNSLESIASLDAIINLSFLQELYGSNNFKISKSYNCSDNIFKIAKEISKIATTYYGKGGAGLLLVCKEDGTVLLLKRSRSVEQPFTWGIPGGALSRGEGWHNNEDSESEEGIPDDEFSETAFREAEEELFSNSSISLDYSKLKFIGQTDFKDGSFTYRTLVYDITLSEKKRISANLSLNWENDKAKWYSLSSLPSNLHFGVKFTKDKIEEQGIDLFPTKKDHLDWIREFLNELSKKVRPESKRVIKELIDEIPNIIPEKNDNEGFYDFRKNVAIAVHNFFKDISKKLNQVGERKAAIETINFASNFAMKPDQFNLSEKDLRKLPSKEQSAHEGFFYHGSELRNAISILKSNKFVPSGAFTRLSLTTDQNVASKFGDTVFVFDAKKLQRRGAKKMNYGDVDLIEKIRKDTGKDIDENYIKNPWIANLYRDEKEWIMQLPYEMRPGELVKIIYFGDTKNRDDSGYREAQVSTNEAFEALDAVTDVPIDIFNYPSFGTHIPTRSKKVDYSSVNLTELVYSSIFKEQNTIDKLEEKYNKASKQLIRDESYIHDNKFIYTNDVFKSSIRKVRNLLYNIGSQIRGFGFNDVYDSEAVLKFYKEIELIKNYLNNNIYRDDLWKMTSIYNFEYADEALEFLSPYINGLKNILEQILINKDKFLAETFSQYFGEEEVSKDKIYIITYFAGDIYLPEDIRSEAQKWCVKNFEKILSIPDLNKYIEENAKDVFKKNYDRYIKKVEDHTLKSRMKELIRYVEPSLVPDQVYLENFLSLIDSKNIEKIPDSRLDSIGRRYISEGKADYLGQKYDANWIFKYRHYGLLARKHKLEVLMLSMGGGLFEDFDERDLNY